MQFNKFHSKIPTESQFKGSLHLDGDYTHEATSQNDSSISLQSSTLAINGRLKNEECFITAENTQAAKEPLTSNHTFHMYL